MQYTKISGYMISKLTLGTAQLGLNYGIRNVNGQPNNSLAFAILDTARKLGITTFDTSRTYGNSEATIGNYRVELNAGCETTIVTKFKIPPDLQSKPALIRKVVTESVEQSLNSLHLDTLPVCLFHIDKDQQLKDLVKPVSVVLQELKDKGLIGIAGISAYVPEDVEYMLDSDILEAVQVPINVLDLRLIKSGRLHQLKRSNKIVFARSIYLQGLLFMNPEEIPLKLSSAKAFIKLLHEIAGSAGVSASELAFSFIRDQKEITSIVFGAETPKQVEENARLFDLPPLSSTIVDSLLSSFEDVPESIITPGLWQL